MKIEESIKNLKEIIDCGYDKNTTAVLDYIDIKSLEIVLNKLKELDDDLYSANCIINEQIDLLRDSISKDTIKEKIEELRREIRDDNRLDSSTVDLFCIRFNELLEDK